METPRKPLNKYWCSVPQQKYIKADRFRFMVLTAATKERKQI
jgi:hypothetical protein